MRCFALKASIESAVYQRVRKASVLWKYLCYGLLISCIPLLVLSFYFIHSEKNSIIAAEEVRYNKVAETAAGSFFEYVQSMQSTAMSFATEIRLQDRYLGESVYNNLQAGRTLQSYRKVLTFASEIGFYTNKTPDIVFYSDGVWNRDLFSRCVLADEGLLQEIIAADSSIYFSGWNEESSILIASVPVGYYVKEQPNRVCFFVLTPRSLLDSFEKIIVGIPESSVAGIWDDKGKLLFANDSCGISVTALEYIRESGINSAEKEGNYFFSGSSNGYEVMLFTSAEVYNEHISGYNSSLMLVIVIDVLLCFVLVGVYAYLNYRPIKKLISSIGLKPRMIAGAEFKMILEEYNRNSSKVQQLQRQNDENNLILLSHAFEKLLNGAQLRPGDEAILNKVLGGSIGCYFAAVGALSENSAPAVFDYDGDKGKIFTIEMFSDGFVVYIAKTDSVSRYAELASLISQKCTGHIGVGSVNVSIESLHKSYLEAILALTRGNNSAITYYENVSVSESDRSDEDRSVSLIQITRMLKNGDNAAIGEMDAMFDAIYASDSASSVKKYACYQLIHKLQQSMQKLNLDFSDEQAAEIVSSGNIELMRKACLDQLSVALESVRVSNAEQIRQLSIRIMSTVDEKFDDNAFNLSMLADCVGITEYTAGHIFKAVTGQNLQDYLKKKRIDAAKDMLASSDASVSDIASAVGFSSCSYFIRVFKAEEGMTPAAFRQTKT